MMYLQIQNLTKFYEDELILDEVSLEIHSGDRIGLVGANGSGKSTFLKILIGEEEDYLGLIGKKDELKISYLRQNHLEVTKEMSVGAELLREHLAWWQVRQEMLNLEETMASGAIDEELMQKYSEYHERFERLGGYQLLNTAEVLFRKLGFPPTYWQHSYATLSGGEKTRVALGSLLLAQPDILLLDEPTNHTDLETMEWLSQILNNFPGVILLVSHDRAFLDRTVNKILELEDGQMVMYSGNYSDYRREKNRLLLNQQYQYEKQQREQKRLKKLFAKQMNWFKQAHLAAGQNDHLRRKAKKLARRAKAYQSKLNKLLSNRTLAPKKREKMNLRFQQKRRVTKDLITFSEVSFAYPGRDNLFTDLTFLVQRSDRIGIIGPNGTGKTTLLKLLLGELKPASGKIYVNPHLRIGYFSQELEILDKNLSPMEILAKVGMNSADARTLLGNLQLSGEEVFSSINKLSLGEQVRVVLAKLMWINPEIMILDEPTNYLDIPGREKLEEALEQYLGTLLIISHDRFLIQRLANKLLIFGKNKPIFYQGRLSDFFNARKNSNQQIAESLLLELKLAEIVNQLSNEELSAEDKDRLNQEWEEIQKKLR